MKAYKKISMVLIQIQVYEDPNNVVSMPKWLQTVIDCATGAIEQKKILVNSISMIQGIIEVFDQEQEDSHPVIQKLSKFILKQQQETKRGEKIINTLWQLMDEPGEHFNVVKYLKNFDQYMPDAFSNVIIDQLTSSDKETKFRAIKKFSIFWRLTAQDKDYVPFLTKQEAPSIPKGILING